MFGLYVWMKCVKRLMHTLMIVISTGSVLIPPLCLHKETSFVRAPADNKWPRESDSVSYQ